MLEGAKSIGAGAAVIEVIKRNLFFYRILISILLVVVIGLACFLTYTYDRSFLIHQQTLMWVHTYNLGTGIPFVYEVHVGHDGTTLTPILIKSAQLIQQAAGPVAESLVAAATSTSANSPLEPSPLVPLVLQYSMPLPWMCGFAFLFFLFGLLVSRLVILGRALFAPKRDENSRIR